jgi:siroheme synthase (precorrin-2 oxidase/ferrochelatase)
MSCIANFQTGTFSGKRPSASYYNLTNLAGQVAGNALYESTLSSSFKGFLGFDWTTTQTLGNKVLNRLGEPHTNFILNYSGINRSPEVSHGIQQIETLFEDGYLGTSYPTEGPLRMKVNEIHLNPRFRHVSAEVFSTGKEFWLKAKTVPNKPESKIDRDFLKLAKFLPQLQTLVDDYGYSDLFSILNSMDSMDLTPKQRQVLSRFKQLSLNNPSVKIVIFDQTEIDYNRSFYDPRTNTVYIAKDLRTPQSQAKFVQDVLHELAHVYTLGALTNPRTLEEYQFRDKMVKIYEDFLNTFPSVADVYGFKNVEEFVAEFLSNPQFRLTLEELEERSKTPKSWFQKLLDSIGDFLNKMFGYSSEGRVRVDDIVNEYLDYIAGNNDIPLVEGEMHIRFNAPINNEQKQEVRQKIADLGTILGRSNLSWSTISNRLPNQLKEELSQLALTGTPAQVLSKISQYLMDLQLKGVKFTEEKFIEDTFKMMQNLKTDEAAKHLNDLMRVFDQITEDLEVIKISLGSMDQTVLSDLFSDLLFGTSSTKGLFSGFGEVNIGKDFSQNFAAVLKQLTQIQNNFKSSRTNIFNKTQPILFSELLTALSDEVLESTRTEVLKGIEEEQEKARISGSSRYAEKIKSLTALYNALETREKFVQYVQENVKEPAGIYIGLTSSLQNGAHIAQMIKNYIDNHLKSAEANNTRTELTKRLNDIKKRLADHHKKNNFWTNLKGKNFTRSYFKDVLRKVSVVYLDHSTGEITEVEQMALNTKQDYVAFQNQYLRNQAVIIKLQNELQKLNVEQKDIAEIQAKQAELDAAQQVQEDFIKDNGEIQFTSEYYSIEDVLDKDDNGNPDEIGRKARQRLDDLRDKLRTATSLLESNIMIDNVDIGIDAEIKDLQQKIRELRNPYDRNGNPKPQEEKEIAERLQKYYAAKAAAQVTQSTISEASMSKFKTQMESHIVKIETAERIKSSSPTAENAETLEKAKEDYKKWLTYNTRRVISPDFYEIEVAPIIEKIQRLTNNPEIKTWMDELNKITFGKKDEDNVVMGDSFSDGEIAKILEIEKKIEALRLADKLTMDQKTKFELSQAFKQLSQVRTKELTPYYESARVENKARIRSQVESTESNSIYEEASKVYTIFARVISAAIRGETPTFTDVEKNLEFFKLGIIVDEFEDQPEFFIQGQSKEDAITVIYEAILNRKVLDAQVQDEWFKKNHTISYSEEERPTDVGTTVITRIPKFNPIRIWYEYLPTNPKYINNEAPAMRWYDHQVNPVYLNPNYNHGRPVPKAGKFVNSTYPTDPELAAIVEDYQKMLDELNARLPKSHRVNNYLLPTQEKGFREIANTAVERPGSIGKGIFTLFKGLKQELYEDPAYIYEEGAEDRKTLRTKPLRIRFKERIPANKQSHDVGDMLLKFMDHAVTTEAMINASPAVISAYESITSTKESQGTLKRIEFDIYRNFYGSSPIQSKVSEVINKYAIFSIPIRAIRRLIGFTSRTILNFAFLRTVKNYISQTEKIFLNRRKYGITSWEIIKSLVKMWTMMKTHMDLQRGSDSINKKSAMYMMLNAIPTADSAHQTEQGKRTFRNKYFSINTVRDLTTGASEFLSGGIIAESLLGQTYVELNGVQVKLEDAMEFDGERLSFKDGVNGYNKGRILAAEQALEQATAQYIQDNQLPANPTGIQLIEMSAALAPFQEKLDLAKKEEESKLTKPWQQVTDLRNKIHNYYYDSVGAYHNRSYIAAKNNLIFSFVMMLKDRWAIPHIQTYFGNSKPILYSGRYHQGIYSQWGSRVWARAIGIKNNSGAAFSRNRVANSPINRFVIEDTSIVLLARLLNLAITNAAISNLFWAGTAALRALSGGGDDDEQEDEKNDSWILALLAMISNGTDDEISTVTNPMIMAADSYTKYVKYRPYVISNESSEGWALVKLVLFSAADNNARAIGNTIESMMMVPEMFKNPLKPYNEYSQSAFGQGIVPKSTTKAILKDQPMILATLLKLSGAVSLNNFVDPKSNLEMVLRYNPKSSLGTSILGLGNNPFVEFTKSVRDANIAKHRLMNYVLNNMPNNEGNLVYDHDRVVELAKDRKIHRYLKEITDSEINQVSIKATYPIIAEAEARRTLPAAIMSSMGNEFNSLLGKFSPEYKKAMEFEKTQKKELKEELGTKELSKQWENTWRTFEKVIQGAMEEMEE